MPNSFFYHFMPTLNIDNGAFYGLAAKHLTDIFNKQDEKYFRDSWANHLQSSGKKKGKWVANDRIVPFYPVEIQSGAGSERITISKDDWLKGKNQAPQKLWYAITNGASFEVTKWEAVENPWSNTWGSKNKAGIVERFTLQKSDWNINNVQLRPEGGAELGNVNVTTSPHRVIDPNQRAEFEFKFEPGLSIPVSVTSKTEQYISETTEDGVIESNSTEHSAGVAITIGKEVKAGSDVAGSATVSAELSANWQGTWSKKKDITSNTTNSQSVTNTSEISFGFDTVNVSSSWQIVDGVPKRVWSQIQTFEEQVIDADGNVTNTTRSIEVGFEPGAWYKTSISRLIAETEVPIGGKYSINNTGTIGRIKSNIIQEQESKKDPVNRETGTDAQLSVKFALIEAKKHSAAQISDIGLNPSAIDESLYLKNPVQPIYISSNFHATTNHAYSYIIETRRTTDPSLRSALTHQTSSNTALLGNSVSRNNAYSEKDDNAVFDLKKQSEIDGEYLYGYALDLNNHASSQPCIIKGSGRSDEILLNSSCPYSSFIGLSDSHVIGTIADDVVKTHSDTFGNDLVLSDGNDTWFAYGTNFGDMGDGNDVVNLKGGSVELKLGAGKDKLIYQDDPTKLNHAVFRIDDYNPLEDIIALSGKLNPSKLSAELALTDSEIFFYYKDILIGTAALDLSRQEVVDLLYSRDAQHTFAALNSKKIDYDKIIGQFYSDNYDPVEVFESLYLDSGLFMNKCLDSSDWDGLRDTRKVKIIKDMLADRGLDAPKNAIVEVLGDVGFMNESDINAFDSASLRGGHLVFGVPLD